MNLEGIHAMRCSEDIEDCLCFVYGQALTEFTKQHIVDTVQRLMHDHGQFLEIDHWFDPAEECDEDEEAVAMEDEHQLAVSDTASTPDKSARTQAYAYSKNFKCLNSTL
jgi:hypothetical protein